MIRWSCLLALALGACVPSATTPCGEGACPSGLACVRDSVRSGATCTNDNVHGFVDPGGCMLCVLSTCGNGVIDPGESCDDGNLASGDGCPVTCGTSCGDGIVDPTEQCDDGNMVIGDGCAANCTNESCGNGNLDMPEGCDDGNLIDGDGCSSACATETAAWAKLGVAPSARAGAALAYDSVRGKLVLFGGCATADPYNCPVASILGETWEFDGTIWTQRALMGNAPSARVGAAMAFDPDRGRMVLSGGCSEFIAGYGKGACMMGLADTWEWDGRQWTQVATAINGVLGRAFAGMAYDSARHVMLKFGGCVDLPPCVPSAETGTYDGKSWTRQTPLSLPPIRNGHGMAFDPKRARVVVFGGTAQDMVFDDVWEWTGTNWIERPTSTKPPARFAPVMAYDTKRSRIVLVGGCTNGAIGPCSTSADDVWEWDGASWVDRTPAKRPVGRAAAGGAYDSARGELVMFAGAAKSVFADTSSWNGVAWSGRDSVAPTARSIDAMAYDAERGVTVAYGGFQMFGWLDETWLWSGNAWLQAKPQTSPPARTGAAAAYDPVRKRFVVFGGYGTATQTPFSDTWEWDGLSWTQLNPVKIPPARAHAAMAYDAAYGTMVMFGGCESMIYSACAGIRLGDTWEWNGSEWAERTPSTTPAPRYGHSLTYDAARANVVLFGGSNGYPLDDTWTWNGTTWSPLMPSAKPSARMGHSVVNDPVRGELVLFGGCLTTISDERCYNGGSNDTWTWNGTTWSPKSTPIAPSMRADAGIAFDTRRGVVVLTGGSSGYTFVGDTWEWNGTAWSVVQPSLAPTPRNDTAMVYADKQRVAILFGGVLGSLGTSVDDTWTWNGTRWTQLTGPNPGPRSKHALTYDRDRGRVVMFGAGSGDTWEWNETGWMLLSTSGPGSRQHPCMAYDTDRKVTVMYGGQSSSGVPDVWEWDGSAWTAKSSPMTPPARSSCTMAYDEQHHVTVMFGGFGSPGAGDTWTWDADGWHSTSPTLAPSGRDGATLVYHRARKTVMLYSGGFNLRDTWEWDGTTWHELGFATNPNTRTGYAITYDPTRNEVVMFGGMLRNGDVDAETWFLSYGPDPAAVCRTGFNGPDEEIAGCASPNCESSCTSCGNATCELYETCTLCPSDCGACNVCGDLHCDANETCTSCPGDCSACP
jgi:cysteine-rich repeat protein